MRNISYVLGLLISIIVLFLFPSIALASYTGNVKYESNGRIVEMQYSISGGRDFIIDNSSSLRHRIDGTVRPGETVTVTIQGTTELPPSQYGMYSDMRSYLTLLIYNGSESLPREDKEFATGSSANLSKSVVIIGDGLYRAESTVNNIVHGFGGEPSGITLHLTVVLKIDNSPEPLAEGISSSQNQQSSDPEDLGLTNPGNSEYISIESEERTWVTAIGSLAAVAAAAAVLVTRAKKKRPKKGKQEKENPEDESEEESEEVIGYVLQLSTDHLKLRLGETKPVKITAWQVDLKGSYNQAADAEIYIRAASGISGLTVSPSDGRGSVLANISLTAKPEKTTQQLNVYASASCGQTSAVVNVECIEEVVLETYLETNHFRPVKGEGLWLYARINTGAEQSGETVEQLQAALASMTFTPTGQGGDWVGISEPQLVDDWMAVWVEAWNPDPNRPGNVPPESVNIRVDASLGETRLSDTVKIGLLPLPRLEVSVDQISFLADSGDYISFDAFIENPGSEDYEFQLEWDFPDLAPFTYEITDVQANRIKIRLSDSGWPVQKDGFMISNILKIKAYQHELTLERHLKVYLSREGLFIDPAGSEEGLYKIKADGLKVPKEIDFRVMLWNEEKQELIADPELAANLTFSVQPSSVEAEKIFNEEWLKMEFSGIRPSNLPSGTYRFHIEQEVPGTVEMITTRVSAVLESRADETAFAKDFTLGALLPQLDPASQERKAELEKVLRIIDNHVPEDLKQKMLDMLYEQYKGNKMGAEELYWLRHDIWTEASRAIMAESNRYRLWGNFIGACTYVAEWTQWAGDKCFEIVVKTKLMALTGNNKWLSGHGTALAKVVKEAIVEFIGENFAAYWHGEEMIGVIDWLQKKTGIVTLYEFLIHPARDVIEEILQDRMSDSSLGVQFGNEIADFKGIIKKIKVIYDPKGAAGGKTAPENEEKWRQVIRKELEESGLIDQYLNAYERLSSAIATFVITEIEKQLWKQVTERLKEEKIRVQGNGWHVTVPVWLIFWIVGVMQTFYKNYTKEDGTLFKAAKDTAWDLTDSIIDDYLEDLAKEKGDVWNYKKVFFHEWNGLGGKGFESILQEKLMDWAGDMKGLLPIIEMPPIRPPVFS